MKIGGLQKMTLLDYPGKVACTLFLSGCNLRCPFCHNPSLVLPELLEAPMEQTEFLDFLEKRRGKLDGVCVTGGEPTVHRDLPLLLEQIRARGFLVKLDTNGSHPGMLRDLLEAGLVQYVAMDIKNSPEDYIRTCGGADILAAAEESVRLLLEGPWDYEFRTTVCKPLHTTESIRRIGDWIPEAKRYYLQNFVDSGHLVGGGVEAFSPEELEQLLEAAKMRIPAARIRGQF